MLIGFISNWSDQILDQRLRYGIRFSGLELFTQILPSECLISNYVPCSPHLIHLDDSLIIRWIFTTKAWWGQICMANMHQRFVITPYLWPWQHPGLYTRNCHHRRSLPRCVTNLTADNPSSPIGRCTNIQYIVDLNLEISVPMQNINHSCRVQILFAQYYHLLSLDCCL